MEALLQAAKAIGNLSRGDADPPRRRAPNRNRHAIGISTSTTGHHRQEARMARERLARDDVMGRVSISSDEESEVPDQRQAAIHRFKGRRTRRRAKRSRLEERMWPAHDMDECSEEEGDTDTDFESQWTGGNSHHTRQYSRPHTKTRLKGGPAPNQRPKLKHKGSYWRAHKERKRENKTGVQMQRTKRWKGAPPNSSGSLDEDGDVQTPYSRNRVKRTWDTETDTVAESDRPNWIKAEYWKKQPKWIPSQKKRETDEESPIETADRIQQKELRPKEPQRANAIQSGPGPTKWNKNKDKRQQQDGSSTDWYPPQPPPMHRHPPKAPVTMSKAPPPPPSQLFVDSSRRTGIKPPPPPPPFCPRVGIITGQRYVSDRSPCRRQIIPTHPNRAPPPPPAVA